MKRLLYISHRVPYPPDKGERCRAFHEVRALSRAFRVTLASLAHGSADLEAAEEMRRWCDDVVAVPAGGKLGLARGAASLLAGRSVTQGYFHSRALHRALRRRGRFDVVVAYSSSMLPYALAVPAAARVADLVDVDSEKWAAYARAAEPPKRWLYALEARGVRRLERWALEYCDAVVLVTQAEADALPARNGTVHAIANGVDADYFSPTGRPGRLAAGLVFTGTMDYRPNVEGVCWFAREVWPHLRRARPGLTFTIVGRDPTRQVRELSEREGIEVTGTVPDVRPPSSSPRCGSPAASRRRSWRRWRWGRRWWPRRGHWWAWTSSGGETWSRPTAPRNGSRGSASCWLAIPSAGGSRSGRGGAC